jgi:hypothetical protein
MTTHIRTESVIDPEIFLESPYTDEGVRDHSKKIATLQAENPDDVRFFFLRDTLVEK